MSRFLAACSGKSDVSTNAAAPPLEAMAEKPGDWSSLEGMVGRLPSESGLIDDSPISVDLNARLGPDAHLYRDAMMRAGHLTRVGPLLVARGPDAWLVIQPRQHAFRAAMLGPNGWRDWQTAGAEVPLPPR